MIYSQKYKSQNMEDSSGIFNLQKVLKEIVSFDSAVFNYLKNIIGKNIIVY